MAIEHQNQPPELPDRGNSGTKVAIGCGLGCLVSVIVVCVAAFLIIRGIQAKVDELAGAVASSEPIEFKIPEVQPHEADSVIERFEKFRKDMAKSNPTKPLILSAEDINVLINYHESFAALIGKVQVDIVNNQFVSDVSVKPEDLPIQIPFVSKAFKGLYINGRASLDLKIQDGKPELYLLDFKIGDNSLPPEALEMLKKENILKDAASDPDFIKAIKNLKELKFENDQLHLIPKAEIEEPELVN